MLAHRYSKRPSEFVQLETEWTAYQLDEACALVGLQTEAAAAKGETPQTTGERPKKYASALGRVTKKIKIPKSGIW